MRTRLSRCACADMTQAELVAMLRSKARKSGAQTSLYRGVSLLKQTGKWHAQINVGGKQVRIVGAMQWGFTAFCI